jgi:predicted Zn-dependent protease
MQKLLRNRIIYLLFFSFILSCNEQVVESFECTLPQEEQLSQNEEDQTEEQRTCLLPTPAAQANLTIDVVLSDFDEEQTNKMLDALERLELVINSEEFKQRILNHEYKGEKVFVDNNGLSNEEIYEVIMKGAEDLAPKTVDVIDLDLTLYEKNNSVVGYTYPNTQRIWVNNKFFKTNSLAKVAKNVAHEWTHKLGFEHDFNRTSSRNYSVPYAVGEIIQELIEAM